MVFHWVQLGILMSALFLNVIFQILSFRLTLTRSIVISLLFGFIFGLVFLMGGEFLVYLLLSPSLREFMAFTLVNTIIFGCVSYCYFHFVNIGEASVRIRILKELWLSPKGMSRQEILGRYNADQIIEIRLERLLKNGQIVIKNGHYFNDKARMLWVARVFQILKRIVFSRRVSPK